MNISDAVELLVNKISGQTVEVDYVATVVNNSPITIQPSAAGSTISTPPSGYTGYLPITVSGDANLIAENIRLGKTIFGVTGSYAGQVNNQAKTLTSYTLPLVVEPDSGYTGLSSVTLQSPSDLVPGNIKQGVTLFGVLGTYTGAASGPSVVRDALPCLSHGVSFSRPATAAGSVEITVTFENRSTNMGSRHALTSDGPISFQTFQGNLVLSVCPYPIYVPSTGKDILIGVVVFSGTARAAIMEVTESTTYDDIADASNWSEMSADISGAIDNGASPNQNFMVTVCPVYFSESFSISFGFNYVLGGAASNVALQPANVGRNLYGVYTDQTVSSPTSYYFTVNGVATTSNRKILSTSTKSVMPVDGNI